jgi:hypothetical protein
VTDGIELVEPTFLKPDQVLAAPVGLRLGGHCSECQRPRNGFASGVMAMRIIATCGTVIDPFNYHRRITKYSPVV